MSGYNPGYDSSSESEHANPRRRGLGNAPAPAANTTDKKKKKKKLPPQQAIDKTWERFSEKKFDKALKVLPFAPVALPTAPERANEFVSVGYERAAEECRRKVRKIIQECKRVNMRYRDPGWDLVSCHLRPLLSQPNASRCPLPAVAVSQSTRYVAVMCPCSRPSQGA